jgi:hypothetical protein
MRSILKLEMSYGPIKIFNFQTSRSILRVVIVYILFLQNEKVEYSPGRFLYVGFYNAIKQQNLWQLVNINSINKMSW